MYSLSLWLIIFNNTFSILFFFTLNYLPSSSCWFKIAKITKWRSTILCSWREGDARSISINALYIFAFGFFPCLKLFPLLLFLSCSTWRLPFTYQKRSKEHPHPPPKFLKSNLPFIKWRSRFFLFSFFFFLCVKCNREAHILYLSPALKIF